MNWSSTTDDTSQSVDKCKSLSCYSDNVILSLTATTIFLAVFGSITNNLSLAAIIINSYVLNVNYTLIGQLNLADIVYLSLVLPMQASAFYYRTWPFPYWACLLLAFIRTWLIGVIMNLHTIIALYRLLCIVFPHTLNRINKDILHYSAFCFIWIEPFLWTVPPLLGVWGSYDFDKQVLQCTFSSTPSNKSHAVIMTTFGYFLPCIFIIICYTYIAVIVLKRQKASKLNTLNQWKERSQKQTKWLTRMLIMLFLNFFIGITPFYIISSIDPSKSQPLVHVIAICFAWLSYCTNPFIYTFMDKTLRDACMRCTFCSEVGPTSTESTRMSLGILTTKG